MKASVRGVKGVACALEGVVISQVLSLLWFETGESSSRPRRFIARSSALGIMDQMPRSMLRKKMKLEGAVS